MASDELHWLMEWYAGQCDGDWEHSFGIRLDTLDNPGWTLTIDLDGTGLEAKPFDAVEDDLTSDVSWWVCKVENAKFIGHCGPRDLAAVLKVFRDWASRTPS